MKRLLQISNGVALIFTIVINYLSNSGAVNGKTVADISGKYHNYFTPAGYAFSIWGVIYIGLLAFVIYSGRGIFKSKDNNNDWPVLKIGWWFVISCVANCCWIIAWLYEYIGLSVIVMVIVLFCLIKIILNARMELDFHPIKKYIFIFWPFAIYAGWISVALIANLAAWLTKIDWNGWGISQTAWAIIMIIVAGAINIFMIWKRNLREYALVGVWALVAIAVANWSGLQSIVYSSIIVAAIIFINISIHAFKNRGSHGGLI